LVKRYKDLRKELREEFGKKKDREIPKKYFKINGILEDNKKHFAPTK